VRNNCRRRPCASSTRPVIEVMVNPDGRRSRTQYPTGRRGTCRASSPKAPIVSAELPETGERFGGVMPPVATAPRFAVRTHEIQTVR
jgi:type IV secretion system protein TrbB